MASWRSCCPSTVCIVWRRVETGWATRGCAAMVAEETMAVHTDYLYGLLATGKTKLKPKCASGGWCGSSRVVVGESHGGPSGDANGGQSGSSLAAFSVTRYCNAQDAFSSPRFSNMTWLSIASTCRRQAQTHTGILFAMAPWPAVGPQWLRAH